jgi:molybdate transport system substrate-binding protein
VKYRLAGMLLCLAVATHQRGAAEPVRLYAAGSLRAAMTDIARAFTAQYRAPVETTFGPSGLLRERIESGEKADVFASADMQHPTLLMRAGRGGPVPVFIRNRLCALAQPHVVMSPETVLETILRPDIRLGTSTPQADPSGDYAWELFRRAERLRPGSYHILDTKALKLTGGPQAPQPPPGRSPYVWLAETRQADVFLTYCTNAMATAREVAGLTVVHLPPELAIGADYGLIVLNQAQPLAWQLAVFILAPEGQQILTHHGFLSGALPSTGP